MRTTTVLFAGILPLLLSVSCSHHGPVAGQTTLPVPVAVAQPSPTPTKSATVAPQAQRTASPTPSAVAAAKPTTMSAEERETLEQRLAHLEDALFDYNQTSIRSDAQEALREDVTVIRGILANYPAQKLLIEGHTDERGSSEYNLALGDRRARATQEFLSDMGIAQSQLSVISFGEERPACQDLTEGCYQRNRRAHITAAR